MLFSHRFGSVETLSRAQFWLTHHGFEVVSPDEPSHDACRLTLRVGISQASAALALIDSMEQSDPEGWPANTTPPRSLHGHEAVVEAKVFGEQSSTPGTPIHWHAHEASSPADPVSTRVREYMLSRSE